jgi:hypothetical protein
MKKLINTLVLSALVMGFGTASSFADETPFQRFRCQSGKSTTYLEFFKKSSKDEFRVHVIFVGTNGSGGPLQSCNENEVLTGSRGDYALDLENQYASCGNLLLGKLDGKHLTATFGEKVYRNLEDGAIRERSLGKCVEMASNESED